MRLILLTILVALVASVGFACGDDDETNPSATATATNTTTLDTYYAELRSIGSQFISALSASPGEVDPEGSLEGQSDTFAGFAGNLADEIEAALLLLEALEPAPEVQAEHAALVASVDNALAVARDYQNQLEAATSIAELQRVAASTDVAAAFAEFKQACSVLKDLAVEYEIQGAFRCE